jgi:hypothetical protein
MNKPTSLRDRHVARPLDGALIVLGPDKRVHRLDGVTGYVYQHADGTRDVAALVAGLVAAGFEADEPLCHAALDRLADAGLLEQRVAPPSGISRRGLLTSLTGAAAIAVLSAVLGDMRSARADGNNICPDESAILDAITQLEADEEAIAALLETAADAAAGNPDSDPLYVADLEAREESHKAAGSDYAERMRLAERDLANCIVDQRIAPDLNAREGDAKLHFDRREEQSQKRGDAASESSVKSLDQIASLQNQILSPPAPPQQPKTEDRQKAEQNIKVARFTVELGHAQHRERRNKSVVSDSADKVLMLESRKEGTVKNLASSLLAAEERKKVTVTLLARNQLEQDQKAAGTKQFALGVANEEQAKAGTASEQRSKNVNGLT